MSRLPLRLAVLPLFAAAAIAQLPTPSPNPPTLRAAPRATWVAVTTAGTTTNGTLSAGTYAPLANTTFRADNPGAASNDAIYVFGGSLANNTATTANDLWKFDAVAGTFTQLIADGVAGSPAHRARASIAWNPATNRLVVFGGNTRGGPTGVGVPTLLNDTWEYDPGTNAWTNVTPGAGNPSPRQHASMCFDPITGGMLLFGGQVNDASPHVINNETWLFLGGVWTQLAPATSPPARCQASLMTRTDYNDCVMCVGLDQTTYNNPPTNTVVEQIRFLDVWRWNGSDWNLLSNYDVLTNTGTQGFPASAIGAQAAYDPLRHRIVVQGGNGHTVGTNVTYLYGTLYGGSPTNWTSEFDSLTNSWTLYSRLTTTPTAFGNNDSVIGRISRAFTGFVPATKTLYKVCGQNAAATGSRPTYNVYSYQANPIAVADPYGTGCSGPGGTLAMAADDLPWNGRTFSVTGTGFGAAPNSVAVLMLSAVGSFPPGAVTLASLAPIVPGGGPGCDLLIQTLDYSEGLLPSAGTATWMLPLPDATVDPTLPGVTFYVQFAELVFAPFPSNWVGTYASNGITCTVGAL
ncbi:MAG: hypothetical protein JNM25_19155 [Planctomycetes bacterium]|nr:hypothetical protein [Planctomycetota bacterium]